MSSCQVSDSSSRMNRPDGQKCLEKAIIAVCDSFWKGNRETAADNLYIPATVRCRKTRRQKYRQYPILYLAWSIEPLPDNYRKLAPYKAGFPSVVCLYSTIIGCNPKWGKSVCSRTEESHNTSELFALGIVQYFQRISKSLHRKDFAEPAHPSLNPYKKPDEIRWFFNTMYSKSESLTYDTLSPFIC